MIGESWEPVHQRLMKNFYEAINANVERTDQPEKPYNFEVPAGFPEGSKEFFENMAYSLVRVQMEGILHNLVDATFTAVAKELTTN